MAGDGEGVREEPAGDGMVRASGVWLKSSRHIGEFALYISFSSHPRNLISYIWNRQMVQFYKYSS